MILSGVIAMFMVRFTIGPLGESESEFRVFEEQSGLGRWPS
jgi:hypothetical protein